MLNVSEPPWLGSIYTILILKDLEWSRKPIELFQIYGPERVASNKTVHQIKSFGNMALGLPTSLSFSLEHIQLERSNSLWVMHWPPFSPSNRGASK